MDIWTGKFSDNINALGGGSLLMEEKETGLG